MLIEAGNVGVILLGADVSLRQWNIEQAARICDTALLSAKSARDSTAVYFGLDKFYALQGQMKKSLEYYNLGLVEFAKYTPPKNLLVHSTFNIDKYVLAAKAEQALNQLKEYEAGFEPQLDKVIDFAYLFYYIEMGNTDEAEKIIVCANEVISGFGEQILMASVYCAKTRIAEIRKDNKQTLEIYFGNHY